METGVFLGDFDIKLKEMKILKTCLYTLILLYHPYNYIMSIYKFHQLIVSF